MTLLLVQATSRGCSITQLKHSVGRRGSWTYTRAFVTEVHQVLDRRNRISRVHTRSKEYARPLLLRCLHRRKRVIKPPRVWLINYTFSIDSKLQRKRKRKRKRNLTFLSFPLWATRIDMFGNFSFSRPSIHSSVLLYRTKHENTP